MHIHCFGVGSFFRDPIIRHSYFCKEELLRHNIEDFSKISEMMYQSQARNRISLFLFAYLCINLC